METSDNKLDRIIERLGAIDAKMAVYQERLQNHMETESNLEDRFKPVEIHVRRVETVFWFISTALGIAATIHLINK